MVALAIKSVLNGIADPTFIVDLSGAVLCHNKAAREWLDAFAETRLADTAGPVPQDTLLQELLPTSKDKINRLLKTCATVSGLIPTSIVLPGNDNTRCRFVIHGNLMRLDENAPPGHIMLRLFRDQGVSSHRFAELNETLKRKNIALQEERHLARVDELTGLLNRRTLFEEFDREFERARRYQRPLAFMLLDLDYFKKINDSYGHPGGDRVLKDLSAIIRRSTRKCDFAGRIGGEEFAVLLPETDLNQSIVVATRICKAVSAHASRYRNQEIRTTVSIGVTESRGHKSLDAIYESADRALYTAKADGRARVVSAVESLQRTVSLSASYPEVKFLSVASGD
ncbi:diguanylate cyclase [Pyruvatibacter mobilis]|uniref:diguanylate cyclase n=1 Tax=Pyruvatibacter mobilis TaxID=1712261 RepID=A0A845QE22_9HYPH|nr:GGDEF domain-containing protein [Pyruvatibacter mobilis]NBG96558.1 diguanylate cyclase [Pyruvatibacter mobilis]QJD74557.1 GGDEF domain-containing protein [Pyruvatibacter mobilis]GGD08053.1 hypothetical protein GCM10011587_09990 [Pyruvatibacter mobilis]